MQKLQEFTPREKVYSSFENDGRRRENNRHERENYSCGRKIDSRRNQH